MKKTSIAATLALTLLGAASAAQAHQIWLEQPSGQKTTVIRFGEFGENLRETSPGLLDKFVKPTATLLSANGEKTVDARKGSAGFELPFGASGGDSIIAEDLNYPLYTWKQGGKETTNWYRPAARLITDFVELHPKLMLDLVPTGQTGEFRLFLKGEPKAKTKVTIVTQSGWAKEARTDEQGLVKFDMPWKGAYVAEVSVNERNPGERPGVNGPEKFDGVSYVTTLIYIKSDGVEPIPAGPVATPGK